METEIAPIQTTYNGYRFRSRTEARWAIAFDILKIEWQYEIEGYNIGLGRGYLPDFKLCNGKYWAEVKPQRFSTVERAKVKKIVEHTGQPFLMLDGPLAFRSYEMIFWQTLDGIGDIDSHRVLLPNDWTKGRFWHGPTDDEIESLCGCPRYTAAVAGARSARFEFGEAA